MKISAVQCLNCKDIIYSRSRHDFRWCSCQKIAVDGGFDYLKIIGIQNKYKILKLDIEATKKQLYDDWNKSINKFGVLK